MTNEETIAYFKEHNEILVSVAKDENVYDYEKQVIEADCMREKFEANEKAIQALEQQPKTGHWLDKKTTIKGGHGLAYGRYGCSVCKKKQPSKTDFCPSCGADMREVNADEEGSEIK